MRPSVRFFVCSAVLGLTACASSASTDSNACTPGIAAGNLILSGGGLGSYKGECGIAGNVTVKDTATADEIAAFQRIQTIGGTLYLPMASQTLTLPVLAKVGGTLNLDGSCKLQSFSAPALQEAKQIQIANASSLATLDLPALADTGTSVQLSGNAALTTATIGATALANNLLVLDNPVLTEVKLPNLKTVSSLQFRNNPLLASLKTLATTAQVTGSWEICNNPALDQTWLDAWTQTHKSSQGTCN